MTRFNSLINDHQSQTGVSDDLLSILILLGPRLGSYVTSLCLTLFKLQVLVRAEGVEEVLVVVVAEEAAVGLEAVEVGEDEEVLVVAVAVEAEGVLVAEVSKNHEHFKHRETRFLV